METKHTKGEWKRERNYITSNNTNVKNFIIASVGTLGISGNEAEANAKLIAAAPELLEALIEIIKSCNPEDVVENKKFKGVDLGKYYVGGCGIPSNKSIHLAINAIKKATE